MLLNLIIVVYICTLNSWESIIYHVVVQVGFGECAKDFRASGIDGNTLLNMTVSQLQAYPCLSNANRRE